MEPAKADVAPPLARWLAAADLQGCLVADPEDGHALLVVRGEAFVPAPVEIRDRLWPDLGDVEVLVVPVAMDYDARTPPSPEQLATIRTAGLRSRFVPIEGDIEAWLSRTWVELLQLERPPGATDHLIDLGGDSITVLELVGQVEERYGAEVDIDLVFDHLELRAMAGLIERLVRC